MEHIGQTGRDQGLGASMPTTRRRSHRCSPRPAATPGGTAVDAASRPAAHGRLAPVSTDPTLLDDLEWRGLIAHSTDLDALRAALAEGSVRFYVGFDPTAPSLHMGNLVQILTAKRLQLRRATRRTPSSAAPPA